MFNSQMQEEHTEEFAMATSHIAYQPVKQVWHVEYPFIAFKNYCPTDKEISILHLAQDMPLRTVKMGDYQFLSFVNHSLIPNADVYGANTLNNNSILILAKLRDRLSLINITCCPWISDKEFDKIQDDLDSEKNQ